MSFAVGDLVYGIVWNQREARRELAYGVVVRLVPGSVATPDGVVANLEASFGVASAWHPTNKIARCNDVVGRLALLAEIDL